MKILFITHNSSRSGAPYVLLQFLVWLRNHRASIHISVLDMSEGALQERFKVVADDYYTFSKPVHQNVSFFQKVYVKLFSNAREDHKTQVINLVCQESYDLVYANTVKAVPLVLSIKERFGKAKIVAHIHELTTVIKLLVPNFRELASGIDQFISVSEMVGKELSTTWGIPREKIIQVHPFSDIIEKINTNSSKDSFTVIASGKVDWRKGSDVFIQVARYVHKMHPDLPIVFEWIGAISYKDSTIITQEIIKLGLENHVFFKGELENPVSSYNKADVFLMCSREDPFPLVCIEMGQLKKPIICFENAVGTTEILKKGGGKIVPYLDIEAMAEALLEYYNNRTLVEKDGVRAAELFSEFTAENQCPKLFAVIEAAVKDAKV